MAFTDMLGQYATNRLQGVQDRLGQAYGLMTGDENAWNQQLGIGETEEERKKRLRREAQARGEVLPDDVVETTSTKTYGDGSQTETVKREIPAPVAPGAPASAATEMTPQPIEQPKPAPMLSMAEQAHQDEMARAGQAPQPQAQPQPQMAAPAPQPQMAAPVAPVAPQTPAPQPQMAAPVAPVAPQTPAPQPMAGAQPPVLPAIPQPGPGVQVAGPAQMPPAAAPAPQAAPAPAPAAPAPAVQAAPRTYLDEVADMSNDPIALFEYAQRPDAPRQGKLMASKLFKKHATDVETRNKAEDIFQKAQAGDTTDLERIIRSKKEEGSYLKAILFARLGLNKLADEEQSKLGAGSKWMAVVDPDGRRALVQFDAQGLPTSGLNESGNELGARDLAKFGAYSGLLKGANVGTQTYRDTVTGETLTKVDTQQGPIYFNKAQQRVVPKGEPVPLTAGSDIATQLQLAQMRRQQQFVGQTAETRLRAYQETNSERALAGMSPLTPEQMGINARGELIGQPQPGMPATPMPPAAPGAPAPAANVERDQADLAALNREISRLPPGASTQRQILESERAAVTARLGGAAAAPAAPAAPAPAVTGAELRTQRLGREAATKPIATAAGEQIALSADTQNMLNSIDKVVKIIDSGNHNLGAAPGGLLEGQLTGETAQRWGERFRTTDARNTKTVMDTVNKLASDGLKALGSNPSTVDLEFWTRYKPDINSDPAFVKDWIESRSSDLKRRLKQAERQVGAGGQAGAAPEVAVYPEKTIDGVTYYYDGRGWKRK